MHASGVEFQIGGMSRHGRPGEVEDTFIRIIAVVKSSGDIFRCFRPGRMEEKCAVDIEDNVLVHRHRLAVTLDVTLQVEFFAGGENIIIEFQFDSEGNIGCGGGFRCGSGIVG